ncbi:MAG TPA: NAD(P)/FAD-dependent oxidoreductase [Gemmatimonadota bacterium]
MVAAGVTDGPPQRVEIAVVGGGPAGLAAAVAGARLNRRTACFEAGVPRTSHAPRYFNVLPFPAGISGPELLERGREAARRWGAEVHDAAVTAVRRGAPEVPDRFLLETATGPVGAAGVVFATGIRDRQPACGTLYDVPGVHFCPICDGFEVRGLRTAVIGRDRDAFAAVEALRDFTDDLTLLLDGGASELDSRERAELAAWRVAVRAERLTACRPVAGGVELRTGDGARDVWPHVFVVLGCTPNTALAASLGCATDTRGFLRTDAAQATSVPHVFAAGDCDGGPKQVTQAMAEGEMAALGLAKLLRRELGRARGSPAPRASG